MNNKISDKDKKDWEEFLAGDDKLPNKDTILKNRNSKKNFTFDFHGFSLDDANKKITDVIKYAYNNEISKLIIVTGKGIHSKNEQDPYVSKDLGILKNSVPEYIKKNRELMNKINRIEDASIEDGGSGAFYIFIKKKLQNKFW